MTGTWFNCNDGIIDIKRKMSKRKYSKTICYMWYVEERYYANSIYEELISIDGIWPPSNINKFYSNSANDVVSYEIAQEMVTELSLISRRKVKQL